MKVKEDIYDINIDSKYFLDRNIGVKTLKKELGVNLCNSG